MYAWDTSTDLRSEGRPTKSLKEAFTPLEIRDYGSLGVFCGCAEEEDPEGFLNSEDPEGFLAAACACASAGIGIASRRRCQASA